MESHRLWSFVADMNLDGSVTISDVWLWIKWFYFYPGDGLVYLLLHGASPIGNFFEISPSAYGGLFSGIVSFIFYGIVTALATRLTIEFQELNHIDKWFWLFVLGVMALAMLADLLS